MQRTLDAITEHLQKITGRYDRLFVIATSALRRAQNADLFADQVAMLTGAEMRILSGEDEAHAAFRGAVSDVEASEVSTIGVLDAGGGSTEYAVGEGRRVEQCISCEIGAVRLTQWCPELAGMSGSLESTVIERAKEIARDCLAPIRDFARVARLILVGGSATGAAVLLSGDRSRPDGLSRATLGDLLATLTALPLEDRRRLAGMNPQRADILPAGIVILDTALELAGHCCASVSSSDLLCGFLLIEREKDSSRSQATPIGSCG